MRGQRIRILLLATILVCLPLSVEAGSVFTTGIQTNPASNTVLADTLAIPLSVASIQTVQIMVASTVNARFALQIRNAANTSNINQFLFACLAFTTAVHKIENIKIQPNQRFRIIINPGVTGNVQATIILR